MDDDGDWDITEINEGLDLLEGDIMEEINAETRVARNAVLNRKQLWDIPVPYVLEANLDVNAKGVILQAFEHFRLKTCIDFRPRQSEEFYLSVRKNPGCYSFVSKTIKSGQVVSIGRRCDHLGTVEHEFLHALGLYHEQARSDRDDYITIIWKNIKDGYQRNFRKLSPSSSTTFNAPYDYLSVMHYGRRVFSKNTGDTIATKLPEYQDQIGQRMEMSSTDVYKLNRLYNCNASVTFMGHCDFSGGVCGMSLCEKGSAKGWKRLSTTAGQPFTDHTTLNKTRGKSYFMHASTELGQEGDSARLETEKMNPTGKCNIQCLQFFYYHSGSESDQLNIWIREFQDETDSTGEQRLMGQITGEPTFEWTFYTVPLNAARPFKVVFEVRKGNDESSGGFSIDDINLSESRCPHHIWEIPDFETLLRSTDYNSYLFSPRVYSPEGYAYQMLIALRETFFGVYLRLVSGDFDSTLEWPCPWRQVTFIMLDKNPHIQHQMSKQITLTTDPTYTAFDNPSVVGRLTRRNEESFHVNPAYGMNSFLSLDQIRKRDFLKGGAAVFLFSMEDISNLQYNSSLPCPKHPPSTFTATDSDNSDKGSCRVRKTLEEQPENHREAHHKLLSRVRDQIEDKQGMLDQL
ncbi:meprin A subunit beta-like [Cheilinus undulatus]|uniref:meprin A subunit beta-like n=1 Tax=Cheilinus undulatus TaxID=241271 RepID=UPI001BD612EB|nr:meprin A subunit beta-like [Cheilinus undulatus]